MLTPLVITAVIEQAYTATLPAQGNNTFSSFLFYIRQRDTPVTLGDVTIHIPPSDEPDDGGSDDGDSDGGGGDDDGGSSNNNSTSSNTLDVETDNLMPFEGAGFDDNGHFVFPASAQTWVSKSPNALLTSSCCRLKLRLIRRLTD